MALTFRSNAELATPAETRAQLVKESEIEGLNFLSCKFSVELSPKLEFVAVKRQTSLEATKKYEEFLE